MIFTRNKLFSVEMLFLVRRTLITLLGCFIFVRSDSELDLSANVALVLKNSCALKSHVKVFDLTLNSNEESDAAIDQILKKVSNLLLTMQLIQNEKPFATEIQLQLSCNIVFVTSFEKLLNAISSDDFSGYFVVVKTANNKDEDFSALRQKFRKFRFVDVIMIFEEDGLVKMSKLDSNNLLDSKNFEAQALSSTKRKTKDVLMKVTTFDLPPFTMKVGSKLTGRDIDLITTIGEALNVTVRIEFLEGDNAWGYLFDNGSGTGAIAKLLNGETDIILGDFFLKHDRLKYFGFTAPYFASQLVFIIPPPAKFTSFEKFSTPFQTVVWYALTVSCTVGILTILVIFRAPQRVKNIFFGQSTSSHLTNMFLIVLGFTQTRMPLENFPRLIIMSFILFCMVIRSAYQGSLYGFLQSDGTHQKIQSLDEMIAKDFNFLIGKSFESLMREQDSFKRR